LERIERIINLLDSKKADNIEVVDLKDKDYLVDYVIIATSLNNRHTLSLLDELKKVLKPAGEQFLRVEEDDNWSIVDLGDIFIHIMTEAHRQKYNLEEFLDEIKNSKIF